MPLIHHSRCYILLPFFVVFVTHMSALHLSRQKPSAQALFQYRQASSQYEFVNDGILLKIILHQRYIFVLDKIINQMEPFEKFHLVIRLIPLGFNLRTAKAAVSKSPAIGGAFLMITQFC